MELNCSRAPRRSQRVNRSVSPFGAFQNPAGDVPASLMFLVADRKESQALSSAICILAAIRGPKPSMVIMTIPRDLSLVPTQRVAIASGSKAKPAEQGQAGGFVVLAFRNYQ
jgi:hypothetical protein